MIQSRRKFLFWLGKAPAIVAASSIMPIVMRPNSAIAYGRESLPDYAAPNWTPIYRGVYESVVANNALLQRLLAAGPNELIPANDPAFYFRPINRNDGFIRHRVVART